MNNQMISNSQMNPANNQMNKYKDKDKMEEGMNKVLPAEMLERIFGELEPKDLKNAVLVCKRWAKVKYYWNTEESDKYDFAHFHFLLSLAHFHFLNFS